ncbi:hypothetical protein [Peribacillus muralis]|uniref:hypothetical protein n=1 Tax=Peribacillus muralis TaxID=264697 RepID=UPI003D000EF3
MNKKLKNLTALLKGKEERKNVSGYYTQLSKCKYGVQCSSSTKYLIPFYNSIFYI